jgi:hypothetical protein
VHPREEKKAEYERNYKELSGSLLKFVKRNDDASVSNQDLGENESGRAGGRLA